MGITAFRHGGKNGLDIIVAVHPLDVPDRTARGFAAHQSVKFWARKPDFYGAQAISAFRMAWTCVVGKKAWMAKKQRTQIKSILSYLKGVSLCRKFRAAHNIMKLCGLCGDFSISTLTSVFG
jgi:hypothetical protein